MPEFGAISLSRESWYTLTVSLCLLNDAVPQLGGGEDYGDDT